jgi:hypothetical protein
MPPLPSPFDRLSSMLDLFGAVTPIFLGLVLLLGSGLACFLVLTRLLRRQRKTGRLPYQIAESRLSVPEHQFFQALRVAVDARYPVFAKVRLGDLLNVSPLSPWIARSRINQNHVDFVVCSPQDFSPLVGVELDDPAEPLPARLERDDFINSALRAAKCPVLRIQAAPEYSTADLRARIHELMPSAPDA